MHGYDTYDYGARGYYAAMGRFMSIDPLAEKKPWMSPYVYCSGNPVNRIDPDGRDYWSTSDPATIERFLNSLK
jgi:RHS repeat-associated protein